MKKLIYFILLTMSCSFSLYANDILPSTNGFDDGGAPPVEDPSPPPIDDNDGPPIEDPPPPAPIDQWIPLLLLAGITFVGYKTLSQAKNQDTTSK